MPEPRDPNEITLASEARRVRKKFAKLKKQKGPVDNRPQNLSPKGGPMPLGVRPILSPEHYHVCYEVDGQTTPFYPEAYPTARLAYVRMGQMGQESMPNTEWYEDGKVMIETKIVGRTGLFKILLSLAMCLKQACAPSKIMVPQRTPQIVMRSRV